MKPRPPRFKMLLIVLVGVLVMVPTLLTAMFQIQRGHGADMYQNVYGLSIPYVALPISLAALVLAVVAAFGARLWYLQRETTDPTARIRRSQARIYRATPADVERIVARDFPVEARTEVRAALDRCATGGGRAEHARYRVQIAVLKLAAGDALAVGRCVELAQSDYRDVLAAAEYPGALAAGPVPAEEQARIAEADWAQFQAWLQR